jgi:tRNA U54 and U55 pseudouridine synthase Pus10
MLKDKRCCELCGKEINVKREYIMTSTNKQGDVLKKSKHGILISEEGVYFEEDSCWFCNSCWKEVSEGTEELYKKYI